MIIKQQKRSTYPNVKWYDAILFLIEQGQSNLSVTLSLQIYTTKHNASSSVTCAQNREISKGYDTFVEPLGHLPTDLSAKDQIINLISVSGLSVLDKQVFGIINNYSKTAAL